jgi:hypothetical protein
MGYLSDCLWRLASAIEDTPRAAIARQLLRGLRLTEGLDLVGPIRDSGTIPHGPR